MAGTGKSLLINMIATLAIGDAMPVIDQGRKDEEFEKRLDSALLSGDILITIDNCDRPLQGSFLNEALTEPYRKVRILGESRQLAIPMNATFFANGNNLVIAGDLTRRVLLCSMDAGCERPELREFETDALSHVQQNRTQLAIAALTALRAWHVSGSNFHLTPLGSFDDWTQRIRKPLVWLGHPDPCDTMAKIREEDPYDSDLRAVISQWREHLGTSSSFTVQEVIGRAVNIVEFHTALRAVGGSKSGQLVDNARLGRWLKRIQGRICDGAALHRERILDGYPYWQLREVE
jgi:putative DNA primase/helicase